MHLYTDKFDLTFTALQIPFLGICSGFLATGAWRDLSWTEDTVTLALGILGVVSLGLSLAYTYRGNRNARMALFVFPLKYVYATIMVGMGFIAILIGLLTLPHMGKSEYLRDEAKGYLSHFTESSGIGATLFRCVGRWNRKLIRPVNVLEEAGRASTVNSDGNESAHVLRDQE